MPPLCQARHAGREPLLVHAFIRARHMSTPAREAFDAIIAACGALAHHGKLP